MTAAWNTAIQTNVFTASGKGFAGQQGRRLARIAASIADGDLAAARVEAERFESQLLAASADPDARGRALIADPAFKAAMLGDAAALRTALG